MSKIAQDIIIRPIITEGSMDRVAKKKYTFEVAKNATKPEIARAVAELFNYDIAEILAVNTVNVKGKPRRRGLTKGHTRAWKKAIVTINENSKPIEFFESMT